MPSYIYKTRPHTLSNAQVPPRDHRGPRPLTVLFSLLVLIASIHFAITLHNTTFTTPPKTCANLIRSTDYTKYVQLQPKTQQMGAIQYSPQVTGGMPSALVQVTGTDAQQTLDIYLYGCTMQKQTPTISLLFKQQGLPQGTVSISSANTLVVGQIDQAISPQQLSTIEPMQQNIYSEYSWQKGTLVQTSFASLYPVTSRAEAEALQEQENNGQHLPWNDPLATAQQMAKDLFQWTSSDPQDAVIDNNGKVAHVQLNHPDTNMQVTVTLSRILQQNTSGLWFVIGAQTAAITLDPSSLPALVTSPIVLKGTVGMASGTLTVNLFDHTLSPLQIPTTTPLTADAQGAFAGSIAYNNNAPHQPGLLLIEEVPPAGSTVTGQLLLTHAILG